jgi:hypothetical protein
MFKLDENIPFIIPSDIPKVYATGATGGYSETDFRVLLYCEEAAPRDEVLPAGKLEVERVVQSEIMLSPRAAKKIAKWLTQSVEEFEGKFGKIPGEEKE